MTSLDSYFRSHGKSFVSYGRWLDEATPEELVAGGVGVGMLFDLYGRGDENISKYRSIAENHMRNHGFTLESTGLHSWKYSLDRNKDLAVLLSDSSCVSMMILDGSSREINDLEFAKDASQVAGRIIGLIQEERISSRLLVDNVLGVKYEIRNYLLTPEGLRIFQTANIEDKVFKVS